MSILYMVATPIGNLQDLTFRAKEVLESVDIIACEDTRHSSILLNSYGIKKPLVSCHGHNEEKSAAYLLDQMTQGKDVAYVSDAGTPGVSDPGTILVEKVRSAGFSVVPIPGASALSAILSVLGLGGKRFAFEGFLSPKSGRRKRQLTELLASCDVAVVYESPFRVVALLEDLVQIDPRAQVLLGRELTKVHEELLQERALELLEKLQSRDQIKGEFVLAIQKSSSFADYYTSLLASEDAKLVKKKKYLHTEM